MIECRIRHNSFQLACGKYLNRNQDQVNISRRTSSRRTRSNLLNRWAIDDDGSYREPMDFEVVDHGYGLHYSTSRTTLGCIKIHDIMDLYL